MKQWIDRALVTALLATAWSSASAQTPTKCPDSYDKHIAVAVFTTTGRSISFQVDKVTLIGGDGFNRGLYAPAKQPVTSVYENVEVRPDSLIFTDSTWRWINPALDARCQKVTHEIGGVIVEEIQILVFDIGGYATLIGVKREAEPRDTGPTCLSADQCEGTDPGSGSTGTGGTGGTGGGGGGEEAWMTCVYKPGYTASGEKYYYLDYCYITG